MSNAPVSVDVYLSFLDCGRSLIFAALIDCGLLLGDSLLACVLAVVLRVGAWLCGRRIAVPELAGSAGSLVLAGAIRFQ